MLCMFTWKKTHLLVNVSVSVDVVQVEGPLQLLSDRAPQQDGQSCHKVLMHSKRTERIIWGRLWCGYKVFKTWALQVCTNLKLYGAGVSWVKCIEEEVCVGAGVCKSRRGRKITVETLWQDKDEMQRWFWFTSMWEELGVNLLESFLIYNTTWTLLERRGESDKEGEECVNSDGLERECDAVAESDHLSWVSL